MRVLLLFFVAFDKVMGLFLPALFWFVLLFVLLVRVAVLEAYTLLSCIRGCTNERTAGGQTFLGRGKKYLLQNDQSLQSD